MTSAHPPDPCPRCGAAVEALEDTCLVCRFPVGFQRAFPQLREAVGEVRREAGALSTRLARIEDQLAAVERAATRLAREVRPAEASVPAAGAPEAQLAANEGAPVPPGHLQNPSPPFLSASRQPRTASPPPAASLLPTELALGQRWLLAAGIVATLLGIGYFLKYSFDRGWIPPVARVAMAYALGAGLLAGGEVARRGSYRVFGLHLIGGGLAASYLATFAAFQIYDLIAHPAAFAIMIGITALAGTLAVYHDALALAILGLIGGFLTPVVLSTGRDHQVALMTYMTILNAGILAIAFLKRWPLLNWLAAAATWILFGLWFEEHYLREKHFATLVFANLFFLIHTLVPFARSFVRLGGEPLADFALAALNAYVAFGYGFEVLRSVSDTNEAAGILSAAYGAYFLVLAALYRLRHGADAVRPFVLLLSQAALFFALAAPLYVSRHWITIFWTLEAVVLLRAGGALRRSELAILATVLLAIASAKFAGHDLAAHFGFDARVLAFRPTYAATLPERWATSALLLAAAALFPLSLKRLPPIVVAGPAGWRVAGQAGWGVPGQAGWRVLGQAEWGKVRWSIFALELFAVLNLEVAAAFHEAAPAARFAAISVLWTFYASALLTLGFAWREASLRHAAIALFGLTAAKVLLVDMARARTPARIISFVVLGGVLIGASFLYHRFKERLLARGGPPAST